MCNIAGYAGSKNAAPILIEMLKKEEYFDGGLSTGIATVYNGKIYHTKVLGSVDDLVNKTDALNLPGTVGIIHSRPDDDFLVNAHPFICEEGKTAVIENGNYLRDEAVLKKRSDIVNLLLDSGVEFASAKITDRPGGNPILPDGRCPSYVDVYTRYVEYVKKQGAKDYIDALTTASSHMFSDSVYLLISANDPENIYVSRTSRPMNIMYCDDGCYLSTSQLAFPENKRGERIESLPLKRAVAVNKNGFKEGSIEISGGNVIDFTPEEYKIIENDIREKITGKPTPLAHLGGGIMVANTDPQRVRPNVKAVYDALWQFEKEGVLKSYVDTITLPWLPPEKLVKTVYFYI